MAKKTDTTGSLQQLKSEIRGKTPGRLYVFHGEEVFLRNHYLGSLKKLLVDDLTESFNYHTMNQENFDPRAFVDAVEAMPMMAESTFVTVDDVDFFKLPEADRDRMALLLGDIPPWCTVVLTYETVSWKPDKRMKKLWEAVQENALVVEFGKQEQRDLVAWIQRHFAARNKRIDPALCVYLIDITGGTMTALSGEIDKIAAYSGADQIIKSDIDAVTEPVLDAVAFQMTDLLSSGNYGAALEKLQVLLKMQEEPLVILGAVGSHFRRISAARTLLDSGRSASDLARMAGVQEYAARKAMDAARRIRPEFCELAVKLVLETDYRIKTSFDDPDRLLELLILRLAQETKHG